MKSLCAYILSILLMLLASVVWACGGDERQVVGQLDCADSIMEAAPDSAYTLLYNIDSLYIYRKAPESLRARYLLLLGTAMNKTDRPMTFDSLFLNSVVRYYDSHGTPGERMRARYIMGCIARDMHEAPRAIDYYMSATECADTLSADCDYLTLMRIYGQMALVYKKQYLYQQEIDAYTQYSKYATRCNNIYESIRGIELQLEPLLHLCDTDRVVSLTDSIYQLYISHGMRSAAASIYPPLIYILIARQNYTEAKQKIDIFESESGLFDDYGNISIDRTHYYAAKAWYYEGIHRLDSAIFFYSKLYAAGHTFDAYRGLISCYKKQHMTDSLTELIPEYEQSFNEIQNSIVSQSILNAESLYDYSRNARMAQMAKLKAEGRMATIWIITSIACLVFILLSLSYLLLQRRHKTESKEWTLQMQEKDSVLKDTESRLEVQTRQYEQELKGKEKKISDLKESKEKLKQQIRPRDNVEAITELQHSDIASTFNAHATGDAPGLPTGEDWKALSREFDKRLPSLQVLMSKKKLSKEEKRICYLSVINIRPNIMAILMHKTTASISDMRRNANRKMYGDACAKTLDANLISGITASSDSNDIQTL